MSQYMKIEPLRFQTPHPNYQTVLIEPAPAEAATEIKNVGRVMHLPTDPGGLMSYQAKALKDLGVPASYCSYVHTVYKYPTDIPSPLIRVSPLLQDTVLMRFLTEQAEKYDIFHFHWGQTFTRFNYNDLPYLKLLNKKTVMTYWGSEIRRLSVARRNNPFARVKVRDEKEIKERLNVVSKFVDAVIAPDHEMFEQMQGYFPKAYLIRQPVDHRKFKPVYPKLDKKQPLVVHAPSDRFIKGTEHILKAVEKLKKSIDFEFVQIENLPLDEAIRLYQKADIIIDQVNIGIYGAFSIESMLLGKPVVNYIRDDLRKFYPPDLPIVSASPLTVEQTLYDLLTNPEKRYKLGVEGRNYAVKHHDPVKIARQLITLYNSL